MIYKINFIKFEGGFFYINDENKKHKILTLRKIYKINNLYSIFDLYLHFDTDIVLNVTINSLIPIDEMLLMLNSEDITLFNMAIDIIKNTKIYDNQNNRNI